MSSALWWALPIITSAVQGIIAGRENLDLIQVVDQKSSLLEKRLARTQVILAFIWVGLRLPILRPKG